MLEKKVFIKSRKDTVKAVGRQIFELRRQHEMSVPHLSHEACVPPILIERWELGKGYLDLYSLQRLAVVFNKRLNIYFEDIEN